MRHKNNIVIDETLSTPKYRQIVNEICRSINSGDLKKGDKIASLNQLCSQYHLSQDTVLMAYNELKSRGIITSQVGKGYFVQSEVTNHKHKILLLFDRLTAYKEELYDAFKLALGNQASEQIFFHHNNLKMFQTILEGSITEYSHFIIMPIFGIEAQTIIGKLPAGKVFILDQGRKDYHLRYPYVCQDFERDIYRVLKQNRDLTGKYQRLVLVVRQQRAHFKEIITGFRDYCKQHPAPFEIVSDIQQFDIRPFDGFIVVDDRDLDYLVRYAQNNNFNLGERIGIISYNETPLKGIVASGITTITTDFAAMGRSMARMIIENQKEKIDNPFTINKQSSF